MIGQVNQKRQRLGGEIRSNIAKLVEERNSLVGEMRKMKEERDGILDEMNKVREKVAKLRDLIKLAMEYTDGRIRDKDQLKELIEKMEYDHETTPTDPQREKEFYKMISQLEEEMVTAETLEKLQARLDEERNKVKEMAERRKQLAARMKELYEGRYQEIKAQIKSLIEEINKEREELIKLKEQRDSLKKERDEIKAYMLSKYVEAKQLKERRRQLYDELNKNKMLLVAAYKSINADKKRAEEEKQKEILRTRAEEIKRKLDNGERVSFEELKILSELETDS